MAKINKARFAAVAAIAVLLPIIQMIHQNGNTKAVTDKENATAMAVPLVIEAGGWKPGNGMHKILDADLDAETQCNIYIECSHDIRLFCVVMAIADCGTGYDASIAGDGGRTIGMMQINTDWHRERLESIGVTDLRDPVQSTKATISILTELTEKYGYDLATHGQFMAYSMGPEGAKKALNRGQTSTAYSRKVMDTYKKYMKEMEGWEI